MLGIERTSVPVSVLRVRCMKPESRYTPYENNRNVSIYSTTALRTDGCLCTVNIC